MATPQRDNKIVFGFAVLLLTATFLLGCSKASEKKTPIFQSLSQNSLDYQFTPKDSIDRSGLMFSDQGAWFAFSLPEANSNLSGFSGPFLMTQQNGIWSSDNLINFKIRGENNTELINWQHALQSQDSYASHLEQSYVNDSLRVDEQLVFLSGHTSLIRFQISNISEKGITIHPSFNGKMYKIGLTAQEIENTVVIRSKHSPAVGYLQVISETPSTMAYESFYASHLETIFLKPQQTKNYLVSVSFIFPEYSWLQEKRQVEEANFDSILKSRRADKESEISKLILQQNTGFLSEKYSELLAKSQLTLQNNWRIPAGEIKHQGLFPSYHYKWFNGFWAWDSWKHAVGLSKYNSALAKDQIRLMFNFQNEDGLVADCVFRDTIIEKHNYRDTKPPLSAWAVYTVLEEDEDLEFVKELYPKLKKYHDWWYLKRDHDQDGLCEYGSTDGSLVAAKWESGMDNAIRFDDSKILKNEEGAYSLDQESVDLNSYLYAEKLYLAGLADALSKSEDAIVLMNEAASLKDRIQQQFYDAEDGWFYDTNLEGTKFIKGAGSEGWTALWAEAATQEQAKNVKEKMMDSTKFFTRVPFQTMSADHPKFDPLKGYWRGPNWLDQAYFGVRGLRNYGFEEEANMATQKILEGAQGLLEKGKPIRENYHPITGKGLHAKNFSWSASHIILLLTEE